MNRAQRSLLTTSFVILAGCGPLGPDLEGSAEVVKVRGSFDKADTIVEYDLHLIKSETQELAVPVTSSGQADTKIDPPEQNGQQPKLTITTKEVHFVSPNVDDPDRDKYLVITQKADHDFGTFWWDCAFNLESFSYETGQWSKVSNDHLEKIIIGPSGEFFGLRTVFSSEPNRILGWVGIKENSRTDILFLTDDEDPQVSRDEFRLMVFPIWNWGEWEEGIYEYDLHIRVVDEKTAKEIAIDWVGFEI
jgi:hypothetical protein